MEIIQELNFDPSICYLNFLIGAALHINSIQNKVRTLRINNDPEKGMGLIYKANALEQALNKFLWSFSVQRNACLYYFGTNDVEEISAHEMQRDETMNLLYGNASD